MSTLARSRSALHALPRRFARDAGGAYAVEFALISSLFVTVVIGLLQFTMVFLARDSLDAALQGATRSILTGSFQKANSGAPNAAQVLTNLKALMCGTAQTTGALTFTCADMKVDITVASSFASSTSGSAVDSKTGTWSSSFGTTYTCPSPKSIAVVRAAVKYPLIARALGFGLGSFSDGAILLQSTAVFRVEPYQSGTGSTC